MLRKWQLELSKQPDLVAGNVQELVGHRQYRMLMTLRCLRQCRQSCQVKQLLQVSLVAVFRLQVHSTLRLPRLSAFLLQHSRRPLARRSSRREETVIQRVDHNYTTKRFWVSNYATIWTDPTTQSICANTKTYRRRKSVQLWPTVRRCWDKFQRPSSKPEHNSTYP
jgi:hypothetical protein